MNEIGIYLHFPFCKRKCNYCDFNSYSGLEELIPYYVQALLKEIASFPDCVVVVTSIYFGGGTPSYLEPNLLLQVLTAIKAKFRVLPQAEITLETNPGTVDETALKQLFHGGFNRLSLGLQASQNRLLQLLGRIHTWEEFLRTFEAARCSGFENIGIDLIFGLPTQSVLEWRETLEQVSALQPEHISAYGLQVEEGTQFSRDSAAGKLVLPTEDEAVAMMKLAMDFLPQAGYDHYEVSNYAKPGYQSRHNLGYWEGRDYLAFGAGAVATWQGKRTTRESVPAKYIRLATEGASLIGEAEEILGQTAALEFLMLGLRLQQGISLVEYSEKYGVDISAEFLDEVKSLEDQGLVKLDQERLALTKAGLMVANLLTVRLNCKLLMVNCN